MKFNLKKIVIAAERIIDVGRAILLDDPAHPENGKTPITVAHDRKPFPERHPKHSDEQHAEVCDAVRQENSASERAAQRHLAPGQSANVGDYLTEDGHVIPGPFFESITKENE